ncbi:AMP-binding protein [Methylopila turkensis]|uniref:Acyl-CoA synthetase n=1 Tax=Methylopila turkensis TaxID=1437816 RepID=A0A9W6JQ72_9HYPH|nr:AMP-binding protein [Methylopila turkensis]GLK80324.1 acyl-CoA synthetase [Methylopila turkensis]
MIAIDDRLLDPQELARSGPAHAAIAQFGHPDGRRFAVCLADPADWLGLFFAIRAVGASVLPIHPATPYAAARRLAVSAGCHALLHHAAEPEALPDAAPSPGMLLQMSSGTTGAPKCVERPWEHIERELNSYVATFREPDNMTPIVACPTTHSYGLICGVLAALKRGRTPVLVDPGNPKHLLKRLRETDRPLLYASPAVLHTVAQLAPRDETLHAAMTSGTLLPAAWFDRIRARTRHMFQQYGCSEAGVVAVNPDMAAPEDMGRPLPHLAVTAGTADAPAEILVRGPAGKVRTSDLGALRPDGMLLFVARLDDTINVSGLNVYPQEVEDVAMTMPGVADAVAFRLADRFAGERVGLVFSAGGTVPVAAVMDWLRGRLASHQLPAQVIQLPAVPRQANGKVSRREIAARHAEGRLVPALEGAAS